MTGRDNGPMIIQAGFHKKTLSFIGGWPTVDIPPAKKALVELSSWCFAPGL
jgi:hypothetical protein